MKDVIHRPIPTVHGESWTDDAISLYNEANPIIGGAPVEEKEVLEEETRQDEWFDVMREWFDE